VALLLAGSLWFVYARGMQNCGWLDRLLGRSGCVDRLDTGWNYHDSLDFSQDGATLLIGGSEDVVLYDFASRRAIQALKTPGGRVAEGAAISADGSQFAMYLNSQFTDQLKIYRRGQTEPFQSIAVGEAAMPDLGFSLDGRSLRFQNASFDIATGAPLGRITSDTSADYRIISQEFSADGSLRIQSNGAEVGLYRSRFDGSIGTLIKILPEPPSLSAPVTAFTDDNRLVATSIHNDDTLIKIWRTSNGSLLTTIALTREENAAVSALAFTPDNRLLLVSRYFQDAIEIYQVPPEANP
jgi:WD40 repeat protein